MTSLQDRARALLTELEEIIPGMSLCHELCCRGEVERAGQLILAALSAVERQTWAWQPIETYGVDPLNPCPVVLRPHRIHGPMDVRRLTDVEREAWRNADNGVLTRDIDWRWVNGDLTTMWTEGAFLPFWMPRPAPPVTATPTED